QSEEKPLRKSEVLSQEMKDEVLIYHLSAFRVHSLESGVTSIWQMCDGETTVAAMAQRLGVTEDVVALGLRRLERAGLLKTARIPWRLSCTRRDLMQRVEIGRA